MMQKKYLISILVVFFAFLLVQCNGNNKALNKKLTEMAMELNTSAPVMLDQHTRFDKAEVTKENVFQYYYSVINTDDPDGLVESSLHSLKENMSEAFGTNPDLRIFKENNVIIQYIYNDINHRTIKSITITPNDYK